MKIIEDKVTVYPPHALCKADIPVIFSALLPAWTEGIKKVRLSAALDHPRRPAYFSSFEQTLTITSRNYPKRYALYHVLQELAARGLGISYLHGHELQTRDVARLRRITTPLVQEILPQLSQKKVWLDR